MAKSPRVAMLSMTVPMGPPRCLIHPAPGFVFDFFAGAKQEPSANGFQVQANAGTDAFTQVLEGAGNALNLINLGPCSGEKIDNQVVVFMATRGTSPDDNGPNPYE